MQEESIEKYYKSLTRKSNKLPRINKSINFKNSEVVAINVFNTLPSKLKNLFFN